MARVSSLRSHIALGVALLTASAVAVVACGSGTNSFVGGSGGTEAGAGYGDGSSVNLGGGGNGNGDDGGTGSTISNVQIVPADASITVQAGQVATQAYKVMGVLNGTGPAVDVTDHFVFWVPDNYLVGDFPSSGGPVFSTRLPSAPTDPPQQGGTLTVEAEALNPGNVPLTVTTSLNVQLLAQLTYPNANEDGGTDDAGLPPNPGSLFGGTSDPSRAPVLEYPNDNVMLPPNLRVLDVHWMPGSASNTLYEITFTSAAATITYYTRCGDLGGLMVAGACGFELDSVGYGYLSASNAGQGNVALTIRGTDDTGTSVGTSATFNIQFAQETVNGGVYYWNVTNTEIMRFDFGGTANTPDVFLSPGEYGTSGTCIGCHALSRDGTKMAASSGGQWFGDLVYVNDIATIAAPLAATNDSTNVIQFASFDPVGDQFVAVYGDVTTDLPDGGVSTAVTPNNLYFHDGNTGVIISSETKPLSFQPDHPSWSPDGTMIAMTHVGAGNTSQREYLGGIDVATFAPGAVVDGGVTVGAAGGSLGDPVVVVPSSVTNGSTAVNSYNPSFAPDNSFLVFSQTTCAASDATNPNCDSDSADHVSSTTWAVTPTAGATPIHLDNAALAGVADGPGASYLYPNAVMLDTFPRSTPFETKQGSGRLFWFTVASLRQPGLRQKNVRQQLWMFAVDPDKILAGQDGSFTSFFLPFQDPKTSNHIAQWTEKIAGGTSAPPVPPPPPPAPPTPPPPK